MPFDLISALRARGKNDALAQLAADEIERLRVLGGVKLLEEADQIINPRGFIITESVPEKSRPAVKRPAAKKAKK